MKEIQRPDLGWPYDEDEDGERVIASTSVGGMSSCSSTISSEGDGMDTELFSFQRQSTVEISVPLDHAEEYPSPSSVSLVHSAGELSELGLSLPALPMDNVERITRSSAASLGSSPDTPFYISRRRRRQDDKDRSLSNDFVHDHQSSNLDLSSAERLPPSVDSTTNSSANQFRPSSWTIRGSPRLVVMLCAATFMALSIHDRVEMARQEFRQQLTSSGSRREEVAFLGFSEEEAPTVGSKDKLPKYYLPKLEAAGGGKLRRVTHTAPQSEAAPSASQLADHRHGSNFAMARAREVRPIFVPDQPLPDGGFRKPVERFVFDPEEQQKHFDEYPQYRKRNALSWTSWLASVAFVGVLLETGWKEYQRCRYLEEEERRL